MTDPLLETIAKTVREAFQQWKAVPGINYRDMDADDVAQRILDRLLSDAGSTQWGVRVETGYVYERDDEDQADFFVKYTPSFADSAEKVRRQVLKLYGPWEEAT